MNTRLLFEQSQPFLSYLADWHARLPALDLAAELKEPQRAAVISEDLVKGFCTVGLLSSPRIQGVVTPAVRLVKRAHELGVPHLLLLQDTHEPDAVEFGSFPPHCIRGTEESETVPELATLPFARQFTIIPKNSLNPALALSFQDWLVRHDDVRTFIIVGDCTDLCVYQIAMALRVRANDLQRRNLRVIIPADCVDTYDLSVDVARSVGAMPHAGDLLHLIFLYHMALNGIEVVATVD